MEALSSLSLNPGRTRSLFTVSDPLNTTPLIARRSRSVRLHYPGRKISGNFPSSGGIVSPVSSKVGRAWCLPYIPEYSCVPVASWADYLADDVVGGSRKGGGGVRGLVDHLQHQPEDTYDAVDLTSIGLQSTVAAFYDGVTGWALSKMISRNNFSLNNLDFVFSTLFFGSIINLLTPSAALASAHGRHMFDIGLYTPLATLSTFGLKAALVAALGFAAGLAISSGLVWLLNQMDPNLATALKRGLRMGLSSNFRYQVLKGLEFLMARVLTPAGFKDLVAVLNNVLGNMFTRKGTDLLESESHSKRDGKDYVNNWGEGASPLGNLGRSQLLMYLKFLVPGGKFICEISVSRFFGSGRVVCEISVSPFFESV